MSRAEIGIETGLWRGAAHSYTCYFTECFIDELARAAGLEPLVLPHRRCSATIRASPAASPPPTSIGGWDGGPPGSGMGIACHSAFGSHIACLVEVEVTREQRLRVLRAVCAVDCGRVINPGDRQAADRGRHRPRRLGRDRPADRDRRRRCRRRGRSAPTACRSCATRPRSRVELIESDEAPGGVTELGVPPAAPAIANAYFSLTGQRVRTLPIVVGAPA